MHESESVMVRKHVMRLKLKVQTTKLAQDQQTVQKMENAKASHFSYLATSSSEIFIISYRFNLIRKLPDVNLVT